MEGFHFNFEEGAIEEEQKPTAIPSENKKDIVCRHWLNHECQRGDACAYLHEMDYDKFPECELGAKCNRPGCRLKHPTRDGERECLFYKQGFCPYGKQCRNKHLRYEAGSLPTIIDISNRSIELSIAPKEKLVFKSGIRKNKCRSYDLKGECQYGENCIYSHETLDIRLAALYSPNEIKMPIPPSPSYVYYFFNFLSMNRLAECIKKGNFYIPERHIDKLNEAYDRSSGCVYIFVSSQSSKLIHV